MAMPPNEIWIVIFQYISKKNKDWLNVILTCKRFRTCAHIAFNTSSTGFKDLLWSIGSDKLESFKHLLSDVRIDPTLENQEAIKLCIYHNRSKHMDSLLLDPRIENSIDLVDIIEYVLEEGWEPTTECINRLLQSDVARKKANLELCFDNAVEERDFEAMTLIAQYPGIGPEALSRAFMTLQNIDEVLYMIMNNARFDPTVCNNILIKDLDSENRYRALWILYDHPKIDERLRHYLKRRRDHCDYDPNIYTLVDTVPIEPDWQPPTKKRRI